MMLDVQADRNAAGDHPQNTFPPQNDTPDFDELNSMQIISEPEFRR
jgi:hypothetical protein